MIYGISISRFIIGFLLISITILIAIILYRRLIRRFSKGHVQHKDFGVLHGLENNTVTGLVEFYFTTECDQQFTFSILDQNMQQLRIVKDDFFISGGHIIRFDTQELEDGIYFYCLQSEKQKTLKKMIVQHRK